MTADEIIAIDHEDRVMVGPRRALRILDDHGVDPALLPDDELGEVQAMSRDDGLIDLGSLLVWLGY